MHDTGRPHHDDQRCRHDRSRAEIIAGQFSLRLKMAAQPLPCPCGGADYAACCGLYHNGTPAPDAAAMMRSRYSAYMLKLEAYLFATWHSSTRPAALDLAADNTKWL